MRRVSPTVAVAWLATSAVIVFVQAESRSAASVPSGCYGNTTPNPVMVVDTPGAGPGVLVVPAAEHSVTANALLNLQSCAMELAQDLDKADAELKAQEGRLDSVEARLDALENKAPDPDRDKPSPEPPSPGSDARLTGRIAVLEREVATLKAEVAQLKARPDPRTGLRTRAPFTVVDDLGNELLRVGDRYMAREGVVIDRQGLGLYKDGDVLALLSTGGGGGGRVSLVKTGESLPRVFLDASAGVLGLADGKGKPLALMSDEGANGPMIAVMSPSGQTLSGVGMSDNGGRVFANTNDGSKAFIAGVTPGGGGEACAIPTRRGPVCLNAALPLAK